MQRTNFGTPALLFLMAALLLPHGLSAQATARAGLHEHPRVAEALRVMEVWLEAQQAYDRIPGLSAAVVHDQETVWTGAYGLAHPDRQEPASVETIYSICSISKLFTAIAVMQLRDEGRLALSDPVDRHLPWFDLRQAPGAPPVTVQGLLTHASGLPRESDHPYWSAPDFEFPTREQIITGLRNQEALYPAWRYFQYSNLGLSLAGEIVRERSGIPFEEYVQNRILAPLGLAHTRPFMPEELWGGQLATGYSAITRDGDRKPVPFFQARGINPAAGFSSTAPDLARFAAWQFRLRGDAEEVLHAHTLQEMQRVHWVDPGWDTFWGLGFGVYRNDGITFVGHSGSCPGYRSQLLLQMDDRVAAIVLANASGVDVGQLARGMYGLLAPALKEAAEPKEAAAAESAVGAPAGTAAGRAAGRAGGDPDRAARGAVDLARYLGTYDAFPWGGETAVVRWKDGLAMLFLPTGNPVRALTRLEHVEGHTFRRIRDDDQPGEPIRFDVDPDGRATALLRFENRYPRVR
jgi:CubicO group peptidase (beta-lactamase class C family)